MMCDIYVIVNRRIADLTDRSIKSNSDVCDFVNGLLLGTMPKDICVVCDSPVARDGHHIAKWMQDERTVPVCKQCHQQLTEDQKLWDRRCELPGQPDNVQQAFILYGIRDICRRRGRKLGDSNYEVYADMLRDDIARLLRGD